MPAEAARGTGAAVEELGHLGQEAVQSARRATEPFDPAARRTTGDALESPFTRITHQDSVSTAIVEDAQPAEDVGKVDEGTPGGEPGSETLIGQEPTAAIPAGDTAEARSFFSDSAEA